MPQIFDNIEQSLLPTLRQALQLSERADFCAGYFNLRGWKAVADIIENWSGQESNCCRLLVGMQRLPHEELRLSRRLMASDEVMDNATALRFKKVLAQELREQLVMGLPTNTDRAALLQLADHLRHGKLVVKGHLRHPLHAKLYLCHRSDPINPLVGFLGSSNFTLSGLEKQGELNVDVLDGDACQKLESWFEDRWDDRWSLDISQELVEIIESSWVRPISPYHIYLKTAYHLSHEARAGQAEFDIPRDFGAQLFDFQTAAIKIAAHHVNTRSGVVLGDVVGLGKTIMACAVASIFQSPPYFLETLVICPANLQEMWKDAFARHRVIGEVMSHGKTHLLSNKRRYRLVIIDESHNLRAGDGKRYKHIHEYIQKNESKVILLSATPYNKHYSDLYHQLRLFVAADKSLGIRPERLLAETGVVEFTAKHQAAPDTLAAFGHSPHADDWRELMRLFLVRRTRSFIKNNYAHSGADGRKYLLLDNQAPFYFPTRVPKTVPFPLDENDAQDQYARLYAPQVVDAINDLHLPRYGLANFLKKEFPEPPTEQELEIIANLSRAGKRLMGFCRTNLLKRLESSGAAFLQSVERHIQRNAVVLHALENKVPVPIGSQDAALLDDAFNDEDEESLDTSARNATQIYDYFSHQKQRQFSWLRADFFSPGLKKALISDNHALQEILNLAGAWNPAEDRKLHQLFELVQKSHAQNKVLVFSQFADTVHYLEKELAALGVKQMRGVTGRDENPTAIAHRFSPISNEATLKEPELRVLIATDVLSEGQNLQDAHIIINYDLPWAIIRLIQRAGRVDRIGQNAPEILCYSFLPAAGVEKLIGLRDRLKTRLHQNAEVIGADEHFFEDETAFELRDLYHEKAGILDEDDGEVDLASHAFQIWKNATDADPSLKNIIPNLPDVVEGAKSTFESPGVIVYTRTPGEMDALAWISQSGEILTQSQWQILRAAACDANTPAAPLADNHHELVAAGVRAALETEKSVGGGLGKPSGARYKAWHVLKRHHEKIRNTLFDTPQLTAVADALHAAPLLQSAADAINNQFKIKASDEHIAQLLMMLQEEHRLVQSSEENDETTGPRLICSLGLV